jgi:hypothetical protein
MKTKRVRLFFLAALVALCGSCLVTTARAQSSTDWGDAPAPYPTTNQVNGARHIYLAAPNVFMGARADTENDGQPQAQALGDDLNPVGGLDDEDGVTFTTLLSTGLTARVQIVASVNGFINAFLDFNGDGDWADGGEQIFVNSPVTAGANTLTFAVPGTARLGITFARFRFTSNSIAGLSFVGSAPNGEVEDYQANIVGQFDFGDAPQGQTGPPFYPTTLSNGGARHQLTPNFFLGTRIDAEVDGQPNATATGDDIIPSTSDDEDGVTFTSPLSVGQLATINVVTTMAAAQTGRLDAFLDLNGDGDWQDAGEQIFSDTPVNPGTNSLSFTVPAGSTVGNTFARFRFSQNGKLGPNGSSSDGEVEDYQVAIQAAPQLDWGDAPEGSAGPPLYPTTLARNGARHTIVQGLFLGQRVDAEANGQPDPTATGDDINGGPDEDGVTFTSAISPGGNATVDVVAAGAAPPGQAFLYAWVDFNQDADWADPGEQIFTAVPLVNGVNSLAFAVPAGAKTGFTFARFRYTRQSSLLSFVGAAQDGEVEDYRISIVNDRDRCDLTCKGRDFWLTFPGAYAPDSDNPVRPRLCIMGPAGTTGTITIAALSYSSNFTIPASMTATINLPTAADLKDLNDAVTNKGIHVVASAEVGVTGISQTDYTTDSYLALHSATLGTEYLVLGWRNVHSNAPPLNGTQFAVVACESNTTVTITPSATTAVRSPGVAYNLVLQAGDAYQLRDTNDFADLTGTIITSDKPVAVFGGHRIANVATSNAWFGDYLVEQLLPVNAWGNNFYAAPLATRSGDSYRCLASEDNTSVFFNGALLSTLNRGQHVNFAVSIGFNLSSDKPVLLAQYARSADSDNNTNADPFMCLVQATRHYSTSYMLCAPTNGFPTNYINVIAPTGSVGTVAVDGMLLGAGAFTTIGSGPYAYARKLVTGGGGHTVTGGAGMAAYIYGWDVYESYGHPGCFFMGDVQPPTITCSGPTNITVNVGANCTATVPDLRQFIQADDNCSRDLSITQTPPPDTQIGPGTYVINVCAQDQSGNKACCQTPFKVIDPSPLVITCPPNMTNSCTSPAGARVFFNVTARQTCGNVSVDCVPPSGSVFPIGTTIVTCSATTSGGQTASCSFTVTVVCAGSLSAASVNKTNITLNWTGATGTLQTAPTPDGPWFDIQTPSNSYTAPITISNAFFRVRHL